ncbi:MAG: hypothetical protein ABI743_06745, partial [bacterium]
MRYSTFLCALQLLPLLILAGCAGHDPVSAPQSATPPETHLRTRSEITLQASLRIDPHANTAEITLPEWSRGGTANDESYLLSLQRFAQPAQFRVTAVRKTASRLEIDWRFAHPFAGPSDPAAAPTAKNRADLGFTGYVVVGVDVPTAANNTYFTDVVANTALIANADCYYRPAALLPGIAINANTFPAQVLVDERGLGNREGISNGGTPSGNFGVDGWTRPELGSAAPYNKWTGFGVLHQGQAVTRTLILNRAALPVDIAVSLPLWIVAKYTDPRAARTVLDRLPAAPADITHFGYRMPQGALDVQRIVFEGSTGTYTPNVASAVTLGFHVEDWDVRSFASIFPDLAQETEVTKVAQGEQGFPTFAVCIPGVLGDSTVVDSWPSGALFDNDSAAGGDIGLDTGMPGDALYFKRAVAQPAGSGQVAGFKTGMARATDPSASLNTSGYLFPLNNDLTPLTGTAPVPITYQAFTVQLKGPPTGWVQTFGSAAFQDSVREVVVLPDGTSVICGFLPGSLDFGGGLRTPPDPNSQGYVAAYDADGAYLWDRILGTSTGPVAPVQLAVSAADEVLVSGWFNGTANFGDGDVMAVREDSYALFLGADGMFHRQIIISGAVDEGGVTLQSPDGNYFWVGIYNGATAPFGIPATNYGPGAQPVLIAKFNGAGHGLWQHDILPSAGYFLYVTATDLLGDLLIGGYFAGTIDWGGGDLVASGPQDGYAVRFNAAGDHIWSSTIGGSNFDAVFGMAGDQFGSTWITGYFDTTCNFGGGIRNGADNGNDAMFVSRYAPDGSWIWDRTFGSSSNGFASGWALALAPDQGLRVFGGFTNPLNFGGDLRDNDAAGVVLNLDA